MQCSVNGCDREARYKAACLCQKHYFRQMRYGTVELSRIRKDRQQNPQGYQWVYKPDHPLRHKTTGYVAEHRAVLYAAIGPGPMKCEMCSKDMTWETCRVDHIDEDVRNNSRPNLRPLCNRCNTWRSMPPAVEWNRTHCVQFEGVRLTPAEWARDPRVNVSGRTIILRIKSGASDAEALFGDKKTHKGLKALENA